MSLMFHFKDLQNKAEDRSERKLTVQEENRLFVNWMRMLLDLEPIGYEGYAIKEKSLKYRILK